MCRMKLGVSNPSPSTILPPLSMIKPSGLYDRTMSEELSSQSTAEFVGLSSKIKKAPRIVIFLLNVFKIEIDTNLEDIYSYNNILKGKQVVVPHTTTISTWYAQNCVVCSVVKETW